MADGLPRSRLSKPSPITAKTAAQRPFAKCAGSSSWCADARAGFTATAVAIDGSKFKAVNSRDRNFTEAKVAKRLEQIEASIERYLSQLEIADRQPQAPELKRTHLKNKIDRLKQEIERMKAIETQLAQQEDTQISLTDPDARSMQGTGKATGTVGYNVQCAVEIKNHLIVAHEVTNAVNDRSQLLSMAKQAKAALGAETMEAFADRGYYNSEEVLACEGTGILPCVPKTQTWNNPNRGLFSGDDFIYDAKQDHTRARRGEILTKAAVGAHRKHGDFDRYRNLTACLNSDSSPNAHPIALARTITSNRSGAGSMKGYSITCRQGSIACRVP